MPAEFETPEVEISGNMARWWKIKFQHSKHQSIVPGPCQLTRIDHNKGTVTQSLSF